LDYPANLIFALRKRHLAQMQREELLLALINCTIANFSFGGSKQEILPEMFMLHPFKTKKTATVSSGVTGENIMAVFAGFPKSKPVK
jgi:hypothetical protein